MRPQKQHQPDQERPGGAAQQHHVPPERKQDAKPDQGLEALVGLPGDQEQERRGQRLGQEEQPGVTGLGPVHGEAGGDRNSGTMVLRDASMENLAVRYPIGGLALHLQKSIRPGTHCPFQARRDYDMTARCSAPDLAGRLGGAASEPIRSK